MPGGGAPGRGGPAHDIVVEAGELRPEQSPLPKVRVDGHREEERAEGQAREQRDEPGEGGAAPEEQLEAGGAKEKGRFGAEDDGGEDEQEKSLLLAGESERGRGLREEKRRSERRCLQSVRKHVGQRPAQIKHEMELAHHEHHPPTPRRFPKRRVEAAPENKQAQRVERAQDAAHQHLRAREAGHRNERLAQGREDDGADKSAGHGAGKDKVVVGGGERGGAVRAGGRAVDEHVVRGLQGEGLLDFGRGREEQVREGHGKEQHVESDIYFSSFISWGARAPRRMER
ncbi:hypothetical protein BBAD15_g5720 [Beauveria bassiana D1-5]|uniref:Uncharacterized protein n=1 Tax=Beauveria bassiana D1-5 TaxID=1245745 RepID=A0A0A2W7I8_BEABA|nr:hypothetical protein BBAD15_g5720 [Beauveria bassiana D1-5]